MKEVKHCLISFVPHLIKTISSEIPLKYQKIIYINIAFYCCIEKNPCLSNVLFSSLVLRKESPSFLSKAQAEDTIHSSFRSVISAINASTGDYVLESANKLFGEKSEGFKEVSKTCV